jgi:hypothetical protein
MSDSSILTVWGWRINLLSLSIVNGRKDCSYADNESIWKARAELIKFPIT